MSDQILTAVISAIVAILAAGSTGYLSWRKTKHEIERAKKEWITELRLNSTLEVIKARLEVYPELLEILKEMSSPERIDEPLTPDRAKQIGKKINTWWYSTGGLCASQQTRSFLLQIRDICCFEWKEGPPPKELFTLKDDVELNLRIDVLLKGLESLDDKNRQSILEELMDEVESIN